MFDTIPYKTESYAFCYVLLLVMIFIDIIIKPERIPNTLKPKTTQFSYQNKAKVNVQSSMRFMLKCV